MKKPITAEFTSPCPLEQCIAHLKALHDETSAPRQLAVKIRPPSHNQQQFTIRTYRVNYGQPQKRKIIAEGTGQLKSIHAAQTQATMNAPQLPGRYYADLAARVVAPFVLLIIWLYRDFDTWIYTLVILAVIALLVFLQLRAMRKCREEMITFIQSTLARIC